MYLGGRSSLVVRMVFVYPFKNKDINIYVSDISSTCDSLKRIMMMKNDQKMSRFTNTKCEESPWFEMAQASFSPWNLLSLFEHVRGQRSQLTGAFRPPPLAHTYLLTCYTKHSFVIYIMCFMMTVNAIRLRSFQTECSVLTEQFKLICTIWFFKFSF